MMDYPHRIRLLGPWECEPLTPPLPLRRFVPPGRLRDADLAGFVGTVRLVRRFGYPGRIDDYEHVWLTFDAIGGTAAITLNDHAVASAVTGAAQFEVTPLLQARNRLEVRFDAAADDSGLPGEIALEVRRDAYLQHLAAHCERDGILHVTGQVHGTSTRPLELYVLAAGRHVAYALTEAHPDGQPFDLACTLEPMLDTLHVDAVHVELVCVAECWHTAEVPVALR